MDFLKYVENPEESEDTEDSFIKSLKEQIAAIKRNRDWEARFMLFEEMMQDEREAGRVEGLISAVLTLLSSNGEISTPLKELICKQKNENTLKQWLTIAASVHSPEEFQQRISS